MMSRAPSSVEQELVRGAHVQVSRNRPSIIRNHARHSNQRRASMVLRRTVLVTLAAAATTSSFAQTAQDRLLEASAGSDDEYIRRTLAAGSLSLSVSRMAQDKLQADELREFAQLETAEQETLADVLKSLQNPAPTDRTIKPPGGRPATARPGRARKDASRGGWRRIRSPAPGGPDKWAPGIAADSGSLSEFRAD